MEHSQPPRVFSIRDRVIPAITVVLVVGLLSLLAYAIFGGGSSTVEQRGGVNIVGAFIPMDERDAPDFTLEGFDGESVQLSDFEGRFVVLNFWASWCGPCRDEAPVFAAFDGQSNPDEAVMLGVAIWDSDSDSRRFLREYRLTYPNAPDNSGEVAIDYGLAGVPETFFISPEGTLLGKYPGEITSLDQLDEILTELGYRG